MRLLGRELTGEYYQAIEKKKSKYGFKEGDILARLKGDTDDLINSTTSYVLLCEGRVVRVFATGSVYVVKEMPPETKSHLSCSKHPDGENDGLKCMVPLSAMYWCCKSEHHDIPKRQVDFSDPRSISDPRSGSGRTTFHGDSFFKHKKCGETVFAFRVKYCHTPLELQQP